jgi:hypothetical protein
VQTWDEKRTPTRAEQDFLPPPQKIKIETTFSTKETGKPEHERQWEREREEGHSSGIIRFVKRKGLEMLTLPFLGTVRRVFVFVLVMVTAISLWGGVGSPT